jgi:hypothetical protein
MMKFAVTQISRIFTNFERAIRYSGFQSLVPDGTDETSPAFQRRGTVPNAPSPVRDG